MTILSAPAQDETGKITLKWFNQPYRSSQLQIGEIVYASGRVIKKNGVSLINPSLSQALPGIVPVYPTVKGVNQRAWRDSIFACLESVWDRIPEPLPRTLLERYNLVPLALALRHAHLPFSREALELARRRLDFENTLLYFIIVELQKRSGCGRTGFRLIPAAFWNDLKTSFRFRSQTRNCACWMRSESILRKPVPMNGCCRATLVPARLRLRCMRFALPRQTANKARCLRRRRYWRNSTRKTSARSLAKRSFCSKAA
jgi:ATP-dependent DNA helicase RecG